MSPDVTIPDVWTTLAKRDQYASVVLARMYDCTKEHGNAAVKIGFRGKGIGPCFRVTYTDNGTGKEEIFGSFIDSGKSFEPGFERIMPGTWSSRSMALDELLAFCAEREAAL